ncbi:MAG TPA: LON peptidase substrate-binding domain-containing protein, partial [Lapillicoccus sp.]|nr:LON peptidase substrate-binding domain-containing protein [Lapillicoccus sp.]
LQVFEDRYIALLRHLIDSKGEELGFGVLAIRHGYEVGDRTNELYAVGCLAVLDRVVQVNPALFLVLTHGTRRFRLDTVDEVAGTPWTTAEVTWLEDLPGHEAQIPVLADAVRELVHVHGVTVGLEMMAPPDDPDLLAYWAAESLDLDRDDRQRLLEVSETSVRLTLVRRMAQRESALALRLGLSGGPGASRLSLN